MLRLHHLIEALLIPVVSVTALLLSLADVFDFFSLLPSALTLSMDRAHKSRTRAVLPLSEEDKKLLGRTFFQHFLYLPFCDMVQLSSTQMRAMICNLKDEIGTTSVVGRFAKRRVDIRSIDWPNADYERRMLRGSLSTARKKLQSRPQKTMSCMLKDAAGDTFPLVTEFSWKPSSAFVA